MPALILLVPFRMSTNTCPIFCWWPGAPPWSTAQTWSHKVWMIVKEKYTLQEINIFHLGKRKIIFKMDFSGDMLVPRRVFVLLVWWYSKWVNGNMLEMGLGLFILIASRFPGAFLRRRFPPQFQPLTVAQWDSLSRWLVPVRQWTPLVWHQSKQWATTRRAP